MGGGEPSPLSPRGLRDLYLAPRTFFARSNLTAKPAILIAVWIMGMAAGISGVDDALILADFGKEIGPYLAAGHSWPVFWFLVVVLGVLNGWLIWVIGGWWYRVRLELSGANEPDSGLARAVYTYQSLVEDVPIVFFTILFTFAFADYAESLESDALWTWLPGLFFFWSIAASYHGARTAFPGLSKGKAVFWFIVAPLAFYVVLLLAVAILATIYSPEA